MCHGNPQMTYFKDDQIQKPNKQMVLYAMPLNMKFWSMAEISKKTELTNENTKETNLTNLTFQVLTSWKKTPIYQNHSSLFSMGPEAKESSKY
jgi:hypothetical protein